MTRDDVLAAYTGAGWDYIDLDAMADEIVRLREALKHETQWADAGIDSTAFWQQQRDDLAAKLSEVEAERDALRDELTQQSITLSAEHQRAERIIAVLREPSEAVLTATHQQLKGIVPACSAVIRAAVAAAEQEVQGAS